MITDKIIEYVRNHPGCRQREIAVSLHVWQCDPFFMGALADLEDLGRLRRESYQDIGNMEYYYKWYVKE